MKYGRYVVLLASLAGALTAFAAAAAEPMVAVGINHTLALNRNGTVYAWGSDADGKLGQARQLSYATPIPIAGLPKVTQVSAAGDLPSPQIAALDLAGNVWTWGAIGDWIGPRGDVPAARPGRVEGIDRVAQVSAGRSSIVALRQDGTVWYWGLVDAVNNGAVAANPTQVAGLTGVTLIAAGDRFILAMRGDGTVWGIGRNACGELGDGSTTNRAAWVRVQLPTGAVSSLHASDGNAAAVIDGFAHTWGQANCAGPVLPARPIGFRARVTNIHINFGLYRAALVDGTVQIARHGAGSDFSVTTEPRLAGALAIAGSLANTYAVMVNRVLRAVGDNNAGQLGNGNLSTTSSAVTARVEALRIAASGRFGLAIAPDGTLLGWGEDSVGHLSGVSPGGVTVPVEVALGIDKSLVKSVHVGLRSSFAVLTNGRLMGWGNNDAGSLGTGDRVARSSPVESRVTGIASVAVGPNNAIALKQDGTVVNLALVGEGGPAPTLEQPVAGLASITAIAAGGFQATYYALDANGRLYGWGDNRNGAIGNGQKTETLAPVQQISLPGSVRAVSTSGGHTLALLTDGRVFAWGQNSNGQLGDGTRQERLTPVAVALGSASGVSAGVVHSLAHVSSGIFAWGFGAFTGLGSVSDVLSPTAVTEATGSSSVSAGYWASTALRADGSVAAWGESRAGANESTLGDGSFALRLKPVLVLRENGLGRTDTDDWYLDLDAGAANSVPTTLNPRVAPVATSTGAAASFSMAASVSTKAADANRAQGLYVVGRVPPTFLGLVGARPAAAPGAPQPKADADLVLVQLTPTGWQVVTGQLTALTTNVIAGNSTAQRILNNINLKLIPGARFCVGYGTDANAMLQAGTLAEVLTLPGATSTSGGLPCLVSGAYISGPQSSRQGTSVSFKATVVGIAPSGSVQFRDGAQNFGAILPLVPDPATQAVSAANVSTSVLSVGERAVSVSYSGDGGNNPASISAVLTHTVLPVATPVSVAIAGAARARSGEDLRLQIEVRGDAPTGTVQLRDGSASVGAAVNIVNGIAAANLENLAVGQRNITAVYSGDARNAAATSSVFVVTIEDAVVGTMPTPAAPVLQLVGSPQTLRAGQTSQITATHTDTAVTGSASFVDEQGSAIGSAAFAGGVARATFTPGAPGRYRIYARFAGDATRPALQSATIEFDVSPVFSSASDSDGDGVNDALEETLGINPFVRDNDVFAENDLGRRLFVMQIYRDFLGREGDASGIGFWASEIAAGRQSRVSMAETFFNSAEFQGSLAPVARLYFATYLRLPDYDGLQFWSSEFARGRPLNSIGDVFVTAAEFVQRYGALNNRDFIDRLYQNVLGRNADAGGIEFWTGRLNGGVTRGAMLVSFSESPEYVQRINSAVFVNAMYVAFLRRSPDVGGFDFWRGELDRGRSGRDLVSIFVVSGEYRARFLP